MAAPTPTPLHIHERDVLLAVLEFLQNRRFHIAQVALERESGLINGDWSEDVVFLRQLIIDGQTLWSRSGTRRTSTSGSFCFIITKYKFFELLCIKQQPGPMQDNDFAVEEIVECLKNLEQIAPTPEEYRHLCALLTLPHLTDHAEFKNWTPQHARVGGLSRRRIYPLVADLLNAISLKKEEKPTPHACNDRLIQLISKGLFYESCVDFCQTQALGGPKAAERNFPHFGNVLAHRPPLAGQDLSLVSWLEVLGNEQFTTPFAQRSLDFHLEGLRKPKLEAQWSEQILATPIKPSGFPHNLVPHSKPKFAEKMSRSMMLPPMSSSRMRPPAASSPMSRSTAASIGSFVIADSEAPETIMEQSAILSEMLQTSELAKQSRPQATGGTSSSGTSTTSLPAQLAQETDRSTRLTAPQMYPPQAVPMRPMSTILPGQMPPQQAAFYPPVQRPVSYTAPMPPPAARSSDGPFELLEAAGPPPRMEVVLERKQQHRGSVYCCGFNSSGNLLATGSNDKSIRLMSFNAAELKIGAETELNIHDGTVRDLIFLDDPRGSLLVSGGAGNSQICLTDCGTGRTFKQLSGHTAPILGLYSWAPGSFVSCSQDKSVRFWDVRAANAVNVILPSMKTTNSPVTSVCVDPGGKLLVSGHEDASVMLCSTSRAAGWFRRSDRTAISSAPTRRLKIALILQDDFFKQKEDVRQVASTTDPNVLFWHYDEPAALDEEALCSEVRKCVETSDVVVVEGNMITEIPALYPLFNRLLFVTVDYETCKQRRELRDDYDPPDLPGYFDQLVWPAYEEHLKSTQALDDPRVSFVDGSDPAALDTILQATQAVLDEHVCIQEEPIDVNAITDFVTSEKCGGISVFIGTTRDNFEGKAVKTLWYEHYGEMANCELKKLCRRARERFPSLGKIALVHRIGDVPIGQKSVVIATSAPHRAEAIRATEFLIDELKATVPIWKKEIYESEESSWKANA
ncbi:hypothetical protein M3Y99_00967900 [Aphelenchoides fujianensis]|nr:hypothetical protein M3Y99_00967900 [Aphelenchoides fujianensis]